jgi:lysine-N-methylase
MKLFAPKYYEDFSCIADKCRHSCCIGWEIDVDADTLAKYSEMKAPYAENIRDSIERDETPHFRLCADGRCAHLDEKGLCRIISNVGEGALCAICREHPRFYHTSSAGREVGLGLCCEEACRIVLSSDNYADFTEIGEVDADEEAFEFDAAARRARIYLYMSDRTQPYAERLRMIYRKYNFTVGAFSSDAWEELLESIEFLNEDHRGLFGDYSPYLDTEDELELPLERALAYFVYRHCSSAANLDEFRTGLGFALFCERLLSSMAKNNPDTPITDLARILSEEIEYSEENCDAIKTEIMFL